MKARMIWLSFHKIYGYILFDANNPRRRQQKGAGYWGENTCAAKMNESEYPEIAGACPDFLKITSVLPISWRRWFSSSPAAVCCSVRSRSGKPQLCLQGASASLLCRMPPSGFWSGFPISIGLLRIGCAGNAPPSLHCLLMVYAFS